MSAKLMLPKDDAALPYYLLTTIQTHNGHKSKFDKQTANAKVVMINNFEIANKIVIRSNF